MRLSAFLAVFLFATPAFSQRSPAVIGHRGSAADRPENTLAALKRGIEAGARVVEFDVRQTKDGQLVLMHDATVDRTTDGKGKVADLAFEEIRKLDAGKWFDPRFAGERVPTLAEALAVCRGKIDVLVDLQEPGPAFAETVVAVVKEHGEPNRTLFGVRSIEQAKLFRRLLPESRRIGLIPEAEDFDAFVGVGVDTIRLWARWLSDETLVQRVRWSGAKVLINPTSGKVEDVVAMLKHRPDFLSADDPAALLKILAEAPTVPGQPDKPKIAVVVDTDLGSDIDDVFALGLTLASPELDLKGVTTVGKDAADRAWLVRRFLTQSGRRTIPVAAGSVPEKPSDIDWQIQYRRHPALIYNRMGQPEKSTAVELLQSLLKDNPKELTVIALGPLTNIAALLDKHPESKPWIKRIVIMGGAIKVGYTGQAPVEPEWNILCDIPAARKVLASGVPITLVPLDATAMVKLERESREKLFAALTPLTLQIQSLYELWDKETPVLFDPVAVSAVISDRFCSFEDLRLEIDDKGFSRPVMDRTCPVIRVATRFDREKFIEWLTDRLTATGKAVLPRPARNSTKFVDRGEFPSRIHVAEDYETEIEKRWWMAGKAQATDLPRGSTRGQRAVLTQDFDDLQGDLRTMYRAVIFNPVPGPPMGPNTRLTFDYKLSGTDTLRVQLYSLTNGYHRYLSVSGLEQGKWLTGTVDMTQMRRPDGTGGPLAADERIDDIQFYIDPRAELLIDNVVLYDAAPPGEKRPFPQRIVFTGGFDTGKQGQEWPGEFEIVNHEKPLTWKYAKAVQNKAANESWVRVSLRGARKIDEKTEVSCRYRLTGTDSIKVVLRNSQTGWSQTQTLTKLKPGEWGSLRVAFAIPSTPGKQQTIDEVRFLVSGQAELGVDDVLICTPSN